MIKMEELLIEKVRSRQLLFNTKCRDYRDQNKRCEAWDEIGRELNMPGELVKDTWERLRRCYTNALHRRRCKRDSKRIFPWKFEREMSFLIPFLEVRKSRYNPTGFDENLDASFQEEFHIKEDLDNGDADVQDNLVENLTTHFMEQVEDRSENGDRRQTLNMDTSERLSENYSFGKPMYQQIYSPTPSYDGFDESDMFYLSMSRMAKQLPKLEQAKIKLLLSKSILEAEIKQESEANSNVI